jgi:hypothetical protein
MSHLQAEIELESLESTRPRMVKPLFRMPRAEGRFLGILALASNSKRKPGIFRRSGEVGTRYVEFVCRRHRLGK